MSVPQQIADLCRETAPAPPADDVELPLADQLRLQAQYEFDAPALAEEKRQLRVELVHVTAHAHTADYLGAMRLLVQDDDVSGFFSWVYVAPHAELEAAGHALLQDYVRSESAGLVPFVGLILTHAPTAAAWALVKETAKASRLDPDVLTDMLQCVISGSEHPIITCLTAAALLRKLAKQQVSLAEDLDASAAVFSRTAIALVDSFESEHVAALALQELDVVGNSPLSVAIENEDILFIGAARVHKYLNAVWGRNAFMRGAKIDPSAPSFADLLVLMGRHPGRFFRLPAGKFVIEVLGYLIFVGLVTALSLQQIFVYEDVRVLEVVVWFFVAAFVSNEVWELHQNGLLSYFTNKWNILDIVTYSMFTMMIFLRLSYYNLSAGETPGDADSTYNIAFAGAVIMLWLRLSYFMQLHETLGPLLASVQKNLIDVANFAAVLLLIMIGFALGFVFLLDGQVPGYTTFATSMLTMYRAALGDFDFGDYDDVPERTRNFAQFMLAVYLLLTNLIALNLLIAILAETFSAIQETSAATAAFSSAELVLDYDSRANELPPPLNLFVGAFFVLTLIVDLLTCRCLRKRRVRIEQDEEDSLSDVVNEYKMERQRSQSGSLDQPLRAAEHRRGAVEPAWTCAHCRTENPARTREAIRAHVENTLSGFEQTRVDMSKLTQQVWCIFCLRQKKEVDELGQRRERASYYVFLAILWGPILLAIFVPFVVLLIYRHIYHALKNRSRPEVANVSMEGGRGSVVDRQMRDRQDWVSKHWASPEVELEDVMEAIKALGGE